MEQHGVFCTVFNLEQQLEPLRPLVLFVTTECYNSVNRAGIYFIILDDLFWGFLLKFIVDFFDFFPFAFLDENTS